MVLDKTITTSKMPKETEQEYTAWLLYCETRSLEKMLRAWKGLWQGVGEMGVEFEGLKGRLGEPPTLGTIERWSKKYHWVERKEIKIAQAIDELKKEYDEIVKHKIYRIAKAFNLKLKALERQIQRGEGSTVHEIKELWEMLQVEIGKPTSRLALKPEEEQKLLTPEEEKEGKEIDEIIKNHERRQKKEKHPILDKKGKNKKRKRRTD